MQPNYSPTEHCLQAGTGHGCQWDSNLVQESVVFSTAFYSLSFSSRQLLGSSWPPTSALSCGSSLFPLHLQTLHCVRPLHHLMIAFLPHAHGPRLLTPSHWLPTGSFSHLFTGCRLGAILVAWPRHDAGVWERVRVTLFE